MDDRLHRRLARAEWRLRWLGWMSMVLVLINIAQMALLFLSRMAPVQTSIIAVSDRAGTERIRLDASGPEPFLSMCTADGRERLRLALRAEDVSLFMLDPKGRVRLALGAENNGGGLSLFDERENLRSEMRVYKSTPGIYIRDEKHIVRVALGMSTDGSGLYLRDAAGKPRSEWSCLENNAVRLILRDRSETPLLAMAVDDTNHALVVFQAAHGGKAWKFPLSPGLWKKKYVGRVATRRP